VLAYLRLRALVAPLALASLLAILSLGVPSGVAATVSYTSPKATAPAPDLREVAPPVTLKERHVAPTWTAPLSGSYRLTGRFGSSSSLWSTVHTGLDFAAPYGTPLVASTDGVVTFAGYDGAYGYKTVVTLEDGTELWYCHQSTMAVGVGERVAVGQVIGYVGTTGNTTGPHLHLEVRPGGGDPVDPWSHLSGHGVVV